MHIHKTLKLKRESCLEAFSIMFNNESFPLPQKKPTQKLRVAAPIQQPAGVTRFENHWGAVMAEPERGHGLSPDSGARCLSTSPISCLWHRTHLKYICAMSKLLKYKHNNKSLSWNNWSPRLNITWAGSSFPVELDLLSHWATLSLIWNGGRKHVSKRDQGGQG